MIYNVRGGIVNIYLISCNSYELIKEKLNEIVKIGLNVVNYDMNECKIDNILEEAAYLSLFDEQKYIIVKNAKIFSDSKISEEDTNKLLNYVDNSNPKTTIIFITDKKLDERKKIVKVFKEKCNTIIIPELNEEQLYEKVAQEFKNNGYHISQFGVKYIIYSCLNNYDLIWQEIKKIITYKLDDKNISDDDVVNLVSVVIDDNIFNFTNAVIKKDIKSSFQILEQLKLLKQEPIVLLIILANQYRLIYQSKILKDKGKNQNEIAKELKASPNSIWHALQNAYHYSSRELIDKIDELATLDYNIKSGKVDRFIGFELFLLNV